MKISHYTTQIWFKIKKKDMDVLMGTEAAKMYCMWLYFCAGDFSICYYMGYIATNIPCFFPSYKEECQVLYFLILRFYVLVHITLPYFLPLFVFLFFLSMFLYILHFLLLFFPHCSMLYHIDVYNTDFVNGRFAVFF